MVGVRQFCQFRQFRGQSRKAKSKRGGRYDGCGHLGLGSPPWYDRLKISRKKTAKKIRQKNGEKIASLARASAFARISCAPS
jgi:hypothetical protein